MLLIEKNNQDFEVIQKGLPDHVVIEGLSMSKNQASQLASDLTVNAGSGDLERGSALKLATAILEASRIMAKYEKSLSLGDENGLFYKMASIGRGFLTQEVAA